MGVAELHGVPHIYEAEFDHSTDEYGDSYFLSPIDPELLALVLEDWAIWCRWDVAHKREVKQRLHRTQRYHTSANGTAADSARKFFVRPPGTRD